MSPPAALNFKKSRFRIASPFENKKGVGPSIRLDRPNAFVRASASLRPSRYVLRKPYAS
jgi:hypothetical protein